MRNTDDLGIIFVNESVAEIIKDFLIYFLPFSKDEDTGAIIGTLSDLEEVLEDYKELRKKTGGVLIE